MLQCAICSQSLPMKILQFLRHLLLNWLYNFVYFQNCHRNCFRAAQCFCAKNLQYQHAIGFFKLLKACFNILWQYSLKKILLSADTTISEYHSLFFFYGSFGQKLQIL
eukprot:TRINITY_DN839_c0_g1_i2.p7 TRINITY_DN839_c0_g1~~TRINITY_DN839_c0_g1_i2.p7  ORF type:complete len:108 (+),score=0.16 TRINITY_DN839_c0_g1_i2:1709-2032(+)